MFIPFSKEATLKESHDAALESVRKSVERGNGVPHVLSIAMHKDGVFQYLMIDMADPQFSDNYEVINEFMRSAVKEFNGLHTVYIFPTYITPIPREDGSMSMGATPVQHDGSKPGCVAIASSKDQTLVWMMTLRGDQSIGDEIVSESFVRDRSMFKSAFDDSDDSDEGDDTESSDPNLDLDFN